jgi:hypothetical protein
MPPHRGLPSGPLGLPFSASLLGFLSSRKSRSIEAVCCKTAAIRAALQRQRRTRHTRPDLLFGRDSEWRPYARGSIWMQPVRIGRFELFVRNEHAAAPFRSRSLQRQLGEVVPSRERPQRRELRRQARAEEALHPLGREGRVQPAKDEVLVVSRVHNVGLGLGVRDVGGIVQVRERTGKAPYLGLGQLLAQLLRYPSGYFSLTWAVQRAE